MIDEEISVPKGSDDTLLNKIFKTHGTHPNVKRYLLFLYLFPYYDYYHYY